MTLPMEIRVTGQPPFVGQAVLTRNKVRLVDGFVNETPNQCMWFGFAYRRVEKRPEVPPGRSYSSRCGFCAV